MPIVTRSGKGTPLTIDEMDGNFTYLEELIGQGGSGATGATGPAGATGPSGEGGGGATPSLQDILVNDGGTNLAVFVAPSYLEITNPLEISGTYSGFILHNNPEQLTEPTSGSSLFSFKPVDPELLFSGSIQSSAMSYPGGVVDYAITHIPSGNTNILYSDTNITVGYSIMRSANLLGNKGGYSGTIKSIGVDQTSVYLANYNHTITGQAFNPAPILDAGPETKTRIDNSNVTGEINLGIIDASGDIPMVGYTAPLSATDTGVKGEIRITSTFIYTCINTNTWVRSVAATW